MRLLSGKFFDELHVELNKHGELVLRSVEILRDIVANYEKLKYKELVALYEELNNIEHKADNLKRSIINTLRLTRAHPEDKEDLLALVFTSDDIAGLSKAVAKKLVILKRLEVNIDEKISGIILSMLEKSVSAVRSVLALLRGLRGEEEVNIPELSHEIEKYEKEVDELRLHALEELFRECKEQYSLQCTAVPIMIDNVEEITDKCEELSDTVKLYAVSRGLSI